jgi:hypothetical protein
MTGNEAKFNIMINKLLEDFGWRFLGENSGEGKGGVGEGVISLIRQ